MLLSMELSVVAIIIMYLAFSYYTDDIINQIFSLIILTVAAAETVIGLLLLINFINLKQNVGVENI